MKTSSVVTTDLDRITYQIIGLAMDIHNELGSGHREHAYHDALAARLGQTDLSFLDEPELLIEIEGGITVQKYIPDFIVENIVIVELKAQTWPMTRDDMAQIFDYFAGADCRQAVFLNFGRPRLEHHRLFPPKNITLSRLRKPKGAQGTKSNP